MQLKYKVYRNNLSISICSIDSINIPLCVIPRMDFLKTQYLKLTKQNMSQIQKIKMWSFNLQYVDRNSWLDFTDIYRSNKDANNPDKEFITKKRSASDSNIDSITSNNSNNFFLLNKSDLEILLLQRLTKNQRNNSTNYQEGSNNINSSTSDDED